MAVAKEFGVENYAKLDPLTVGLSQADALIALTTGRAEITAHFTSPPFSYLEVRSPNVHRVLNSVDVLGNITLSVVFALKKFTDDNPRLAEAFIAAMDETNDFIAKNKDAAAEIYIRSSRSTMKKEDLTEILSDRDTQFSTTPTGVMLFANFMGRAGTLKRKPLTWTDAFSPLIKDRLGN
jgi:NitT/TauT family transport system substrate-binding protein